MQVLHFVERCVRGIKGLPLFLSYMGTRKGCLRIDRPMPRQPGKPFGLAAIPIRVERNMGPETERGTKGVCDTRESGRGWPLLVEVGAAQEVAAGAADEFAAAVLQAGGAGGAVDLMVVTGFERADLRGWLVCLWPGVGRIRHADRIARVGAARTCFCGDLRG